MTVQQMALIALRGIRAHKLRASLTMLGLMVGVASVIVLSAFSGGVLGSVNAAIAPIANTITVTARVPPTPGGPPGQPLTDDDVAALASIPQVASITPTVTGATTGHAGQVAQAVLAETTTEKYLSANVIGTTANWLRTNNRALAGGGFFTDAHAGAGARVAVLGPAVATALFGPDPSAAIGQTVRIRHRTFRIIGLLKSYGLPTDASIVMPETAARTGVFGYGYGGDELSTISVMVTSTADVSIAEQEINRVLGHKHRISDPRFLDFQIQDIGSRLDVFKEVLQLLIRFIPLVAGISLLVGGIGVLSMMLTSVTDRTREIGIRKAIGASDSAVLVQFALEAIVVAGLGGLIGVAVGIGSVMTVSMAIPLLGPTGFLSTFSPTLGVSPVVVSFAVSLAIGLAAGGYPAWRAAQLNPIQALRYE